MPARPVKEGPSVTTVPTKARGSSRAALLLNTVSDGEVKAGREPELTASRRKDPGSIHSREDTNRSKSGPGS